MKFVNMGLKESIFLCLQIFFYLFSYFIGVIGNVLVIIIILNRNFKTVAKYYVLNLAIIDLLYLQIIPFAIITLIFRKWIFGIVLCKIYWLLVGINQFTSVFLIVALAFDR